MRKTVGSIMCGVGAVFGLGAMWWWAISGMTPEQGAASGATAMSLIVGGVIVGTMP